MINWTLTCNMLFLDALVCGIGKLDMLRFMEQKQGGDILKKMDTQILSNVLWLGGTTGEIAK